MPAPVARAQDQVVATDVHIVMVPAGPSLVPTPLPHPFTGVLDGGLSTSVRANGRAVATVDSTASNQPPHLPTPPGTAFQSPPSNRATVTLGSQTVKVGGKAVARAGDVAETCNDPTDLPVGTVVAAGTVLVGG